MESCLINPTNGFSTEPLGFLKEYKRPRFWNLGNDKILKIYIRIGIYEQSR